MNFNKLHLLIKLAPCPCRTNFTLIKNGSYRVTAITQVQINDPLTCFHWLYFLSGFILLGLRSNTYIYNLLQINLNMRVVVIWSIEDSTLHSSWKQEDCMLHQVGRIEVQKWPHQITPPNPSTWGNLVHQSSVYLFILPAPKAFGLNVIT